MLSNEAKRQVFMKLRAANYRASLRLEGMVQQHAGAAGTSAAVKPSPAYKSRHGR